MTYCVALKTNAGMVFLSDTRTNAGVDNISKYKKMFTWEVPGDRVITMMTAGNLAVTQAVISLLQENIDKPQEGIDTLLNADTMFRIAEIVGDAMRVIQNRYGRHVAQTGESTLSSIIVGGQRAGGEMRLFHVYSAGNFIEAGEDTPYFQIGEHKYGKPILDRVITVDTPVDVCVTAALLSMDSTLRSNLSVGMPLDLSVIARDELRFSQTRRIDDHDPSYLALSDAWSNSLRNAFLEMAQLSFSQADQGTMP
ncbi:peptidase [Octadecabacter sp. 1_MG-2023]|uniref:peptidase n=1 Tax=unclassified Octadecabacter TaxID=196158 RepID=UPI001C087730|nr:MULTISPECIES: peptidase [unclassified Octadecabacter]MBU2994394.1 peptidase [Octadecabacter sp. B2R22]MDO6734315.1 peptidase [Octadecabacter sp. 1_MG-2023]